MLAWFLFVCALMVGLFELWWAIGYANAYRNVRAPAMLAQMTVGLSYVAFVLAIAATIFTGQVATQTIAVAFLVIVGIALVVWRLLGGPALQARHYPRGWRDVLAFRRPTVDLRRRVRGK